DDGRDRSPVCWSIGRLTSSNDLMNSYRLALTENHIERSSQNAFEGPPSAATALADSLGENARWSRIMVIGSQYPTVLAWSLSSCRSALMVLLRVTWCSSFHPKRWYETKLAGSGRSLYVFLTIAWSQSMTVSGRKKWSALPRVVGGAPQSRKLELILKTV